MGDASGVTNLRFLALSRDLSRLFPLRRGGRDTGCNDGIGGAIHDYGTGGVGNSAHAFWCLLEAFPVRDY